MCPRNSVVSVLCVRNGQRYPKSLIRSLIAFACGEAVAGDVDWRASSRRLLFVNTRSAARAIGELSGRKYLPDGERFYCRPDQRGGRQRRARRRRNSSRRAAIVEPDDTDSANGDTDAELDSGCVGVEMIL